MLCRQKIAQTKAEHKGNSGGGAVQQHGSADFFFFKKMKKGAEPLLSDTTPAKGPQ